MTSPVSIATDYFSETPQKHRLSLDEFLMRLPSVIAEFDQQKADGVSFSTDGRDDPIMRLYK